MPCRIRVPDRIIIHIRVPIPRLRALRSSGDNGVGRSEPANRRVKPARAVKIKPKLGLFPLTGELVVRAEIAGGEARLTEGFVERGGGLDSARIGGDRGTPKMIREQIGESSPSPHGESRRAREIIFRDDSICHFVVIAHEVRGHAVDGLGYAVAIAVIHKRGGDGIQGRHGQNFHGRGERHRNILEV